MQGATDIAIDRVEFAGGHLTLGIAAVGGGYEGDLDGDTSTGTWSQAGNSLPLTLERRAGGTFELTLERTDEVAAAPTRPQHPQPPYPYELEEVQVVSAGDVTLAGTLTRPRGNSPVPAAVLITGSGPQDRDEALMGHKPFHVLADHLTRQGVAVLRLDDRGVGDSTGSFATATSEDFADDALAAVAFLAGRNGIGPIGLIGHSEGGLVAPMAANRSDHVAFVILLAGPGLTGEEILYRQSELIIKAGGGTDELAAVNRRTQEAMFQLVKTETDPDRLRTRLREALEASLADAPSGAPQSLPEAQIQAQIAQTSKYPPAKPGALVVSRSKRLT